MARVAAAGLFAVLLLICACGLSAAPVMAAGDGAADGNMGASARIDLTERYGNDSVLGDAERGNPDINGDGKVDIYDAGYLMNVLKQAGGIVSHMDDETVKQSIFRCDLKQDALVSDKDLIWPQTQDVVFSDFVITKANRAEIGYTGEADENLVIPEKFRDSSDEWHVVTAIGTAEDAANLRPFYCCSRLASVTIPETVTLIGSLAFYGCFGLSGNLVIPNNVTYIGKSAFGNCQGLVGDLVIPNSVTYIGESAFYGCSGLNGVLVLPSGITSIEKQTFYKCSGLVGDLKIPDSVMSIGLLAFSGCSSLNGDLTMSDNVSIIGDSAFCGCKLLNGVLRIPGTVISIGDLAFSGCESLDGLLLGDGVETIGDSAFSLCSGLTGDLIIPDTVKIIGNSAFDFCDGFDGQLLLGSNIESIGDQAFSYCDSFFGDLTIPDSVKVIGSRAFYNCKKFDGFLSLGSNIESIGDDAFYCCLGLSGDLILPHNMKTIGSGAFWACENLSGHVIIPDSVTTLGDCAFQCSNNGHGVKITGFTVGKNVSVMNGNPFACKSDKILFIDVDPENQYFTSVDGVLYSSDMRTLVGYPSGKSCDIFNIPDSVSVIGQNAFAWVRTLGDITIPDGVTEIGDSAFLYFGNWKTLSAVLILPETLMSIGPFAFQYSDFSSIVIPDNVNVAIGYSNNTFGLVSHIEYHGSDTNAPWGAKTMN